MINKLQEMLRDILDLAQLQITEETTSADIEEWDSLATVSIIAAVIEEFNIQVTVDEINHFKDIRSIIKLIETKKA